MLTHNHVSACSLLSYFRKGFQGAFAARFQECCVPDQSDAFEPAVLVSVAVKDTAVQRAHDPVVANETHHGNRVYWPCRQELEHFRLVIGSEAHYIRCLRGLASF